MKENATILKNEDGMALVVALLILALITIIAITASQDTVTELQIVRNDLVYKDHLYRAEASALEGVQWVDNSSATVLSDFSLTSFLSPTDIDLTTLDLNDGRWNLAGVDPNHDPSLILTGYTVVDDTGPIDLSAESNVYTYKIYGFYDRPNGINRGRSMVEIGYKKRF